MAAEDEEYESEAGEGAAEGHDEVGAPDQVPPEHRQPPSDEETEQDDYANTDTGA